MPAAELWSPSRLRPLRTHCRQTSGTTKNARGRRSHLVAIEVVALPALDDHLRYLAHFRSHLDKAAGAGEPARSSGIPAAQQLWHVSKAHLLELSEEGFGRRAAVQAAALAGL